MKKFKRYLKYLVPKKYIIAYHFGGAQGYPGVSCQEKGFSWIGKTFVFKKTATEDTIADIERIFNDEHRSN